MLGHLQRELFGQSDGRYLAVNKELVKSAQTATESYIQDVLSLCMKAGAQMTMAHKVGLVL